MNIVEDLATASVSKAVMPWLIAGSALALSVTGLAGMYAGYEIAQGRFAADKIELVEAQKVALIQAQGKYEAAQSRGDEISGRFETLLGGIKVENKTFHTETRVETEKQIYTDCKLPDSGADLLKRRVDAVNLRLLSTTKQEKK